MRDTSPRSRELLVKAARMYFLDGRSQDDIARVLETSRSNVSRMLTTARGLGIVEIRIRDERGRDTDLEEMLAERFGLSYVRVAHFEPHQNALTVVGALAAEWLDAALRDGQTLALSWGTALQAVVAAVEVDEPRDVEVVPLVGGLTTGASLAAGEELVRDMAGKVGASAYHYLHGPAVLHSDSARNALLGEPSIGRIIAQAKAADIALVGIGAMDSESTAAVIDTLHLDSEQRDALLAQKPAGNICSRFFDADGRAIGGTVNDRVLGVDLDDLRRIPVVLGVAAGSDKTNGVLAALRGGLVDGLVADACLAHSLLTAGEVR